LAWTFLLPFLYVLGYPLPTIVIALIGMFVCYLILESCTFYVAYKGSAPEYQKKLKQIWWIIFFMPFFRYLVYWFRLAGIITALTEEKSWKTQNPFEQLGDILMEDAKALKKLVSSKEKQG
jgi:hypothetical protein